MMKSKVCARTSIPAALAAAFLGSVGSSFAFAQEPALVKAFPPEYPRAAERREIEGIVKVEITVDANGKVADVKVVSATPPGIFDTAAVNAVKRWKFESGKPASVTKNIAFTMEG